jgi:hypothetical protein
MGKMNTMNIPRETETLPPGLRAKIQEQIRDAERRVSIDKLERKWAPWEGTPETNERIARVPERQRQSPLARMVKIGSISAEELASAHEICRVVEIIDRDVMVSCSSLEARVDHSGSGRNILIESLGRIRAEVAFQAWHEMIPMPRAMIMDMIVRDVNYRQTSNKYNINWRTARKRLKTALRLWETVKIEARHKITEEAVSDVYQLLGEGILREPQKKEVM